MSRYDALWERIAAEDRDHFTMTFDEIAAAAGVPLDHSFLTCKKELETRGYRVKKISMKEKTVLFEKTDSREDFSPAAVGTGLPVHPNEGFVLFAGKG